MRIDPSEYAAFKQILKDFAETDYLPPEKYIGYIGGVFSKVGEPLDPLEIIPLRKNPNAREYYGSEYYNMAYKLKGLDGAQIEEVQSQLLNSIIKTWTGITQLDLMSETVALIQEYTSEEAKFGAVFKKVFDSYINEYKEGVASEDDLCTAWTQFMSKHGNNNNLKPQVIKIVKDIAPVMSNTFPWWNDITFKYVAPELIIDQKQVGAYESLGLTRTEQLKATIVSYNPDKDKSESGLDFSI